MEDIIKDIVDIEHELRDLKTAQLYPSISFIYKASAYLPRVTQTQPRITLTITYKQSDTNETPLTTMNQASITGIYFLPYDATTQTQKIAIDYNSSSRTWQVFSTREILSIVQD